MHVSCLQASTAHAVIDEAADSLRDTLQELLQTMEEAASAAGIVSAMIENINKAIAKVSEVPSVKCNFKYESQKDEQHSGELILRYLFAVHF